MCKVEALAHALADLQPGVKAKTLADTLVDVEAKALFETLRLRRFAVTLITATGTGRD